MRINPKPEAVSYGIDIGKKVFHVVALDAEGRPVQRAKFARDTLLKFFATAAPVRIGMEACAGSQWLARKLIELGHDARIIPAKFVKPYVKSNKTDTVDAEAIAEAVTRRTMRFVEVRSADQVDLQALHRIWDRLIRNRTGLMNQARAFCIEYGLAMRKGPGGFRVDIRRHLDNPDNDLTDAMRVLLRDLLADLEHIERRVAGLTKEIEAVAHIDERTRRLMTIPGDRRTRRHGIAGRGWRRPTVPQSEGHGSLARPRAGRAFDRGQTDPARHQQTWQRLRPPPAPTRRTLVLPASRSGKARARPVVEPSRKPDASQQGGCRAGQQDHQDRLGHPHSPGPTLSAVKRSGSMT